MKTSKVDEPAGPSPKVSGKGWLGSKRDLIERLSAGVNAASDIDRENLAQEMKKLAAEAMGEFIDRYTRPVWPPEEEEDIEEEEEGNGD